MSKSKYLEELENEAIFILREVVAEFERPVMLYSDLEILPNSKRPSTKNLIPLSVGILPADV